MMRARGVGIDRGIFHRGERMSMVMDPEAVSYQLSVRVLSAPAVRADS
jgi:hypothetical protein